MTIYNIKGTNGSAKSTTVLELRRHYHTIEPVEVVRPDRKLPSVIGYGCKGTGLQDLFVFGPYKTACGGCDTFSWRGSYPWIFDQLRLYQSTYGNVIYEGMTLSGDRNWISKLSAEGFPVKAIYLATTLEECHKAVNVRRAEKGKASLTDFSRVDCKYGTVERGKAVLTENNVPWCVKSRDEIVDYLLQELSSDDV